MFAPTVCGWPKVLLAHVPFIHVVFLYCARLLLVRLLTGAFQVTAFVDSFCQPETCYAFENIKKTCRKTSRETSRQGSYRAR